MSPKKASLFQFKTTTFPTDPGVYLMHNAKDEIIYVGKAKNLRNRIKSYFQNNKEHDYKTQTLVKQIAKIEYFITSNEVEALILENNLIKEHQSKYNILLKDDKQFPFLKLTVNHDFPRLEVVRKISSDGARYFGPFLQIGGIREVLTLLNDIFGLRRCKDSTFKQVKRPCLLFQIKKCTAPCVEKINKIEYQNLVKAALLLLEGKNNKLLSELKKEMKIASKNLNYEQAAVIRDQIKKIEKLKIQQHIVHPSLVDQDIVSVHNTKNRAFFCILHIREKRITHINTFNVPLTLPWQDSYLETVLIQFYWNTAPPNKIILPSNGIIPSLKNLFKQKHQKKVSLSLPHKPEIIKLHKLANTNALQLANKYHQSEKSGLAILESIQNSLKLNKTPQRIECYDISTTQGNQTVGAMSVSIEGKLSKTDYRKFKIKKANPQDDYACLKEVLERRFTRSLQDETEPDIIVVDGGKGQLMVIKRILDELNIKVSLIGLAKARKTTQSSQYNKLNQRKTDNSKKTMERIFLPGRKNPLILKPGSKTYNHLTLLRDEAHRFAISYHRKSRDKQSLHSILDDIPGIGPVLKRRLLQHFGSIDKIIKADSKDLESIKGITTKTIQKIKQLAKSLNKQVMTLIIGTIISCLFTGSLSSASKLKMPTPPSHLTKKNTQFSLLNGLKVVLFPDTNAQTISIRMTYKTGSSDDPKGSSGIANIARHLPVQRKYASKKQAINIEQYMFTIGGSYHNQINHESISYTYTLPRANSNYSKDNYNRILEIEANRMKYNNTTNKNLVFAKLRALKDIYQYQNNTDYQTDAHNLFNAYKILEKAKQINPPFGRYNDVVSIKLKDVNLFIKHNLSPNNALITVAGDFVPSEMKRKIMKYFSPIVKMSGLPNLKSPNLKSNEIKTETKTTTKNDKIRIPKDIKDTIILNSPLNQLMAICPITIKNSTDSLKLMTSLSLLKINNNLSDELIFNQIRVIKGHNTDYVYILSDLYKDKGYNTTKAALESLIDKAAKTILDQNTLVIIKRQYIYQMLNNFETNQGIVSYLAKHNISNKYLSDQDPISELDILNVKNIQQTVAKSFKKTNCFYAHLSSNKSAKENKINYKQAVAKLKSHHANLFYKDDLLITSKTKYTKEEVPSIIEKRHTYSNRLKLLYLKDYRRDVIAVSIFFNINNSYLPSNQMGLLALFKDMLLQGTKQKSYMDIRKYLDQFGFQISVTPSKIYALVLKDDLPSFFRFITEILLTPSFPKERLKIFHRALINRIKIKQKNIKAQTRRAFLASVFKNHPFGASPLGTVENISNISALDLVSFHRNYYLPNNCKIFISGNISFDEAKQIVKKHFAKWPSKYKMTPIIAPPKASNKRNVLFLKPDNNKNGKKNSPLDVYLGHINLTTVKDSLAPGIISNIIFNSKPNPSSRLNRILWQEELGSLIEIDSKIPLSIHSPSSTFYIHFSNLNENSLDNLLYKTVLTISRIKSQGPTKNEVLSSKRYYFRSWPIYHESYQQIIDCAHFYDHHQVTPQKLFKQINNLTPQNIQFFMQNNIKLDLITIVIQGELLKKKPYLEKLMDMSDRLD